MTADQAPSQSPKSQFLLHPATTAFSEPPLVVGPVPTIPAELDSPYQDGTLVNNLSSCQHGEYIAPSYLPPPGFDISAPKLFEMPEKILFHDQSSHKIMESQTGDATEAVSPSMQALQENQASSSPGRPEECNTQVHDHWQPSGNVWELDHLNAEFHTPPAIQAFAQLQQFSPQGFSIHPVEQHLTYQGADPLSHPQLTSRMLAWSLKAYVEASEDSFSVFRAHDNRATEPSMSDWSCI